MKNNIKDIKLSILIPSIPERIDKLQLLLVKMQIQIQGNPHIEVISLIDNKKISIGEKRDALVQLANGKYLAFVDDDDDISSEYMNEIYTAIITNEDVDLIMFDSLAILNGKNCNILVDIDNENEPIRKDDEDNYIDTKRKPFHVCAWKSEIAKTERFAAVGYGEDWDWVKRLIPKIKKTKKIGKQLHIF